jgi:ABC-type uncharacterized transport system auxiliary subunit
MRTKKWKAVVAAASLITTLTMSACWGAPQAENMLPKKATAVASSSGKTLRIVATIEGGSGSLLAQAFVYETSDKARISDSVFRQALTDAFTRSGMFSSVTTQGQADYELRATLFQQRASTLGLSYTSARIGVRYVLVETASKREVWRDTLYTDADSGFGISAVAMQSEANEGAMRANLEQLVDLLSRLRLS